MRTALPNRRPQVTERVTWQLLPEHAPTKVYVSAGFEWSEEHGYGLLKELFLRGAAKSGSERDFLLDDIAVLIARALQCGDSPEALAAGMGRTAEGHPTSIVGAVLDAAVKLQAETRGEAEPERPLPDNIIRLDEARE